MIPERQEPPVHEWAVEQFDGAERSDVRRVERARTRAEALAASPGAPLPPLVAHPSDRKAAERFFRPPAATPDPLQAGQRERGGRELEKPGRYLRGEDTREILCARAQESAGLGPVGGAKQPSVAFRSRRGGPCGGRPGPTPQRRAGRGWKSWGGPLNRTP